MFIRELGSRPTKEKNKQTKHNQLHNTVASTRVHGITEHDGDTLPTVVSLGSHYVLLIIQIGLDSISPIFFQEVGTIGGHTKEWSPHILLPYLLSVKCVRHVHFTDEKVEVNDHLPEILTLEPHISSKYHSYMTN